MEKRFHWCVLVASPFFEAIYKTNFLEKQTGLIELHRWPAPLVEQSLLCLYGRKPNVTKSNVNKLLDIAEFLLIPCLKVACINLLRRADVTIDNCMQMLELSSVYGFELESCHSFIIEHLPEVLEQERMLNATTESVTMLMSDPTLCYVPVQNWFYFIIRWVDKSPERQNHFVDLFHMLDLGGCDSEFINNVVKKEPLVKQNKEVLEKTLSAGANGNNDTVVIIHSPTYNSLTCLNLRNMLWYRIDMPIDSNNEEMDQFKYTPITGVMNSSSSCIYKTKNTDDKISVLTYDLHNAEAYVSNVFISGSENNDARRCNFDHYSLANCRLVAVRNGHRMKFTRNGKTGRTNAAGAFKKFAHMTATLYIGRINRSGIEMHAIMSIQNHNITNICCGDNGSIAMLSFDRTNLFIFNEETAELDCIEFEFRPDIVGGELNVSWCMDGFVLYEFDTPLCIFMILRLRGAPSETKYRVKQFYFDIINQYNFDGERWFRIKYDRLPMEKDKDEQRIIEYVNHKELINTEDESQLQWSSISAPWKIDFNEHVTMFVVSLPKGVTMCHLKCPHCQPLNDDSWSDNFRNYLNDNFSDISDSVDQSNSGLNQYDHEDYGDFYDHYNDDDLDDHGHYDWAI